MVVLIIGGTAVYSQPPDTLWSRMYGGNLYDYAYFVQQTSDGGYIIAGETHSDGGGEQDAWLIRLDANGDTLWTETYGAEGEDRAWSVYQTSDEGFIFTGITASASLGAQGRDLWLVRTDSDGDTLWTRIYGFPDGGELGENGNRILFTEDGGYFVAGYTESQGAGDMDVWLLRTDSLGDTLWTQTFGGTDDEGAVCMEWTQDYALILSGVCFDNTGNYDALLMKCDTLGTEEWTKIYGGPGYDDCYGLACTEDGGYILTGEAAHGVGQGDLWLLKTDAVGETLWTKTFGSTLKDYGLAVKQTLDHGYIIAGMHGFHGDDAWLIRTNVNGDSLWAVRYGGPSVENFWHVQLTSDSGYIAVGAAYVVGSGYQAYALKTGPDANVEEQGFMREISSHLRVIPNPFRNQVDIRLGLGYETESAELTIYDVSGRPIRSFDLYLVNSTLQSKVIWDARGNDGTRVPYGVYFIELKAEDRRETARLLYVR
jgi:hypothetical protein